MRRIYIAGPYSIGDKLANVRAAIKAGDELLTAGYEPYVPHLTHYWHELYPHEWERWMKLHREWLLLSDAVVRLFGQSKGADIECEVARGIPIPVFGSVAECMAGSYR